MKTKIGFFNGSSPKPANENSLRTSSKKQLDRQDLGLFSRVGHLWDIVAKKTPFWTANDRCANNRQLAVIITKHMLDGRRNKQIEIPTNIMCMVNSVYFGPRNFQIPLLEIWAIHLSRSHRD